MTDVADSTRSSEIRAILNRGITEPIDRFVARLDQILTDQDCPLNGAELTHLHNMRRACGELRRLTHEHLGGPDVVPSVGSERAAFAPPQGQPAPQ